MNQTEAVKIKQKIERLCWQIGQGICPSIEEIRETIALMDGHPELAVGRQDLEEVIRALSNVENSTLSIEGKEWR